MARKTKKVFLIIFSLIVLVIIALAVIIKIYITPERIKAFLIPEAEKALSRKVNLGEISISLFKGIEVKDFAIKEADGETDFIKCRGFVLKYKFLPLLSKQLIIDQVTLEYPEVRIERGKDGKFNFDGIGKKETPGGIEKAKSAEEPKGLPVSLVVSKIAVKEARFTFIDLKKELPDLKGTLDIDTGIESVGKSELASQGSINLKLEELTLNKQSGKYIKNISVDVNYDVGVNLESDSILVRQADLKIQDIALSFSGDILNIKSSPEINLTVIIPETKLAALQKSLAPFADIKDLNLSGMITADLKVSGMTNKISSINTDGTITLKKAGINYKNVNTTLDGDLKLKKQSADINLRGSVDKNTAEIKGTVSNYLKNQKINLNIYSKQLFLDELIPASAEKDKVSSEKSGSAAAGPASDAAPVNLKLTANGQVKIDSARYKGMTMNNFIMTYEFNDNKLEITKMTASAGKGNFSLNSIIDLSKKGYAYSLSADINSLHADEIINSMFPKAKDTVFGILTSNLRLKGAGTLPDKIRKNLAGNLDFDIKDGKITNVPIARNLSQLLNIKELETLNITQGNGTVKIKNGVAKLNSLLTSDDVILDPKGNIGLDGDLDLAFDLKMSPNLTGNAMSSKVSQYIKNNEGWGIVPIKCPGTFAKPGCMPDAVKAGKQVIKKKSKELIDDLLNRDRGKKEGEASQQKSDDPIDNLLKGIFD